MFKIFLILILINKIFCNYDIIYNLNNIINFIDKNEVLFDINLLFGIILSKNILLNYRYYNYKNTTNFNEINQMNIRINQILYKNKYNSLKIFPTKYNKIGKLCKHIYLLF